jgi:hypothetical protein
MIKTYIIVLIISILLAWALLQRTGNKCLEFSTVRAGSIYCSKFEEKL